MVEEKVGGMPSAEIPEGTGQISGEELGLRGLASVLRLSCDA